MILYSIQSNCLESFLYIFKNTTLPWSSSPSLVKNMLKCIIYRLNGPFSCTKIDRLTDYCPWKCESSRILDSQNSVRYPKSSSLHIRPDQKSFDTRLLLRMSGLLITYIDAVHYSVLHPLCFSWFQYIIIQSQTW